VAARRRRRRPAQEAAALVPLRRTAAARMSQADGQIAWDDFAKVDMRVGRIVAVDDFPEARKPAWKLRIDFGPELGEKRSSAQVTNYSREELQRRRVLAGVNFPPRQIAPFISEVLTLRPSSGDAALLGHPPPP